MKDPQALFENIIGEIEGAELGKLFGKACGKSNKKAFVAFFQGEMVFKIGQQAVNDMLLKYAGSQKWDPSGKKRPMKDWLQVPVEYQADWTGLADAALRFTLETK